MVNKVHEIDSTVFECLNPKPLEVEITEMPICQNVTSQLDRHQWRVLLVNTICRDAREAT